MARRSHIDGIIRITRNLFSLKSNATKSSLALQSLSFTTKNSITRGKLKATIPIHLFLLLLLEEKGREEAVPQESKR
jgi:hypothetical protein